LKEHQDLLVLELNPLIDQINALSDRLNALNIENKIVDARQKLEEWRLKCYRKIDRLFERKCQELDRKVAEKTDKQREEINRIESRASELIREQHTTRHDLDVLTSRIRNLEREINETEQTSFDIRTQSLDIKDSSITIEEPGKHRFDISSLPPVCKTIEYYGKSSPAIASNNRFLLMHQKPNLCLIDRRLTMVKYGLWNDGHINDICWSSVLDRFIVINGTNVFFVDESTLSIEKISTIQSQKWYSCTCSDVSLFLTTYEFGSSVMEYSLFPSIQLIRQWDSPDSCQTDEVINRMRYNNETLALLITKSHTESAVYIELRSSKTLERLWSLWLGIEGVQRKAFCCCLINEDEWLVADHENSCLILITGDGKMKARYAYNPVPWYPCLFGSDVLALSIDKGINFHKF